MQTPQKSTPQAEGEWTYAKLREWTKQFLARKGCDQAELETQVLMAHALSCTRIELFTRQNEIASQEGRDKLRELIRKRAEGCPVAYLVGHKEFFSLSFEVNPSVLIPRPDSEWIVYECLRLAKEVTDPEILDLGTGSGCLAVTLARQNASAQITAVDISPEALEVAERNAELHNVTDRVTFLEGDLFAPIEARRQFDFIVSNPPYVRSGDIEGLQREVRDYEPRGALDAGEDGFAVLDRILEDASSYLKPGGHLIVEIGADQEEPARERFESAGGYELASTIHDAGGHARVLQAQWHPPTH